MLNLRSMASDGHIVTDGLKSLEHTHTSITRFSPLTLGNLGAPLDFDGRIIHAEDGYGPQESTVNYEPDDPLIVIGQGASI